ncbi:MAG: hypothetical protein UX18_C0001G0004 [Candidatus Azambacteria bacterium GW2011_GWC2_45_7b]|nr:MAG: hypothetical protein UW15_C0001G0004 [Parcubacteria group bacterium GW2011_GWC1_44_10]KKT57525.1 MAG: hypothetical protein UW49_C0003G0004 [Candidatus Giovannonibacteria bacterium GW2011_GWB1_44_23]KKT59786.1 MAG: hypothetical protein UW53_C0007G0004 [Candidatus Giovannonibacteria bacterium GW2011_GWA1_44_25]KKU13113.1 MAG: hypothetical protein UX18_C0001G0004 [Candidatus Azambacteria bacterium GW2011_GWC2_45_7b]OGF49517.1 MAG: hypothetical protein A2120_00885 [Candidatus Giovannonibact
MVTLQVVTVPGCVECRRFEEWWKVNSAQFPNVKFEEINALEQKGQELVFKYSIFSSPGLIINGDLFSTGGVNTEKLAAKLKEL